MKNNEQLKKEISDFVKNEIYKHFDWQNGFSLSELKVIAQELFNCRFKIIKIKVTNLSGKIHNFKWQTYQKQYTHDWVVDAMDDISKIKKPKCYITVSISKSDFNAIKKVF
jgi:hypothetical protein